MEAHSLHKYVKEILPLNIHPHVELIESSLAFMRAQNLDERLVIQVQEVEKLLKESKYAASEPKSLEWLWKGHQLTATGGLSVKKSEDVCDFIDNHRAEGITFNKKQIIKKQTNSQQKTRFSIQF